MKHYLDLEFYLRFADRNRRLKDESLVEISLTQCSAYRWRFNRWSAYHFLWFAGVLP
ncbi:hypothetical protein HAX54_032661, partial [Datura stramonium]|nr:hypothetical protein [Datura stramonium]